MTTPPEPDDRSFYWDWAKHEENVFTNRGSFFLVGESMLFSGVATLRSVEQLSASCALPIFYALGIFITLIWLGVNVGHHVSVLRLVQAKLRCLEPRHAEIVSGRVKGRLWMKSRFWMGMIMPFGFLVAWGLLTQS